MVDLPVMSGSLVPDLFGFTRHSPTPVCAQKMPQRGVVGKREAGREGDYRPALSFLRHCEEQRDEAIQLAAPWIASLRSQ